MTFKIIKEPSPVLHQKCKLVSNFDEARKISRELLEAIRSVSKSWNRWLGFASNQIGYSLRMIILRTGRDKYEFLVNHEIIEKKFPFPYLEQCYSNKSLKEYYLVKRYLWVRVKYQNLEGQWKEIVLRGPSAIYHELDHLNGVMVNEIGVRVL